MIEKVPALLYKQFMQGYLDAKEKQMVGESFQYGGDAATRIVTEFTNKKEISVDMAALKLVQVVSAVLFQRGMDNIVLTTLSDMAKKIRKEGNSSIGRA